MIGTDSYHISIELTSHSIQNSSSRRSDPVLDPATQAPKDYRLSNITVSGYDAMSLINHNEHGHEPLKAISLGNGVIRLFRDFDDGKSPASRNSAVVDPHDETMLSIIALPTYFTATDLLGFIGDHYMEYITHIRVLKSEKPNRFLVLLKFNDALKTAEFQYDFDGKAFNSMEPEACHVVFVRSVTLRSEPEPVPEPESVSKLPDADALIPFLMKDPFTSVSDSLAASSDSTNENLIPIELPTCPVCLEKLDCEISGLLTIPCQHTFHCQCLSKWRDDTCPVCRYTNSISNQKIRRSVRRLSQINSRMQHASQTTNGQNSLTVDSSVEGTESCMNCATSDNLWVCLICGNLGCSRYAPEQHSLKHFVESGHCFAMELATSRVWDYAGDNYVHRLITNESDGKIVEFPNKVATEDKRATKQESEGVEYSELLLSQLISQREYYELLLRERNQAHGARRRSSVAENNSTSMTTSGAGSTKRLTELEETVAELTSKLDKVTTNVIPALKQKIDMKQVSLKTAAQELSESNALNDGLSQKVEFLTEENEKLVAQNEDLSEQVKDLMFYLEAQEKFKDQPAEVTEGQIVMKPKKSSRKKKK